MTDPRFSDARITHEGLTATWADVPPVDEQESLVLALIVQRDDGSEVRFGARWIRDAVDSPAVFAWDSRTVQEREHEAPETAITRDHGAVHVVFPRSWVDALIDAHELQAAALISVDGVDRDATAVELAVED